MSKIVEHASTLARALASEARWQGVDDQREHQRRLEHELFRYCDGMNADEVGLHWSFDWVFDADQALSAAIGRVFGRTSRYAQLALKHQRDDHGIVCEVRLPIERYQFDKTSGVLDVTFSGQTSARISRLHTGEQDEEDRWIELTLRKETSTGDRPWSSKGSLLVLEEEDGAEVLRWAWDYRFTTIADRPDYNLDSLLDVLSVDGIPGGIGHVIPILSGAVEGSFTYDDGGTTYGSVALGGGYVDGNFARASADTAGRLVHDHWGWLAMPRLWSVQGVPVEHMIMAGWFKAPPLPGLAEQWSGVVLWRRGPDAISPFRLATLLTSVDVRHHSAHYLDATMITSDRRYRITFRIWNDPMVSQFVPPESRAFHDHQDLRAEAYVVVEQNIAPTPLRWIRPRWVPIERLVTPMAGCEFGEREGVIGSPDYPAYAAVPEKPEWLVRALENIASGPLSAQTAAYRLEPLQPPH